MADYAINISAAEMLCAGRDLRQKYFVLEGIWNKEVT